MPWGQLVSGPPGSGKSTYCAAQLHLLRTQLGRAAAVVNLDFANEATPYECAVDVGELVSLEDVMHAHSLGPNGGLIFCAEFLEANVDWLVARLRPLVDEGHYLIFDTPGQAELYTYHEGLAHVLVQLQRRLGLQLAALHLVDSHLCSEPFSFIAASLLSLHSMVRLELPHLNVLTKCDMRANFDNGPGFGLEMFTDMMDLGRILPLLDEDALEGRLGEGELAGDESGGGGEGEGREGEGPGAGRRAGMVRPQFPPRSRSFIRRFHRLHEKVVEVVTDFNLVSFTPISIKDPESLLALQATVDKATGFVLTRSPAGDRLQAEAATERLRGKR